MKRFALVGAGGYVAPRHMNAIKETGNTLVAALDPSDSVGIIDSYFPHADFFVEFERFDRHIDKLRRKGAPADYVSICSPNYLHDAHIRFALRSQAHAICEKPLVLNPWNIDGLAELEKESEKKVYTILQLRLHPSIISLKEKVVSELADNPDRMYTIDLTYLTSRGNWYFISWKGDEKKSGGIATNIGIHFYDMLSWIFGPVMENVVHVKQHDVNSGYLRLANAHVRWFLSVNEEYLPAQARTTGQRTYRSITVDREELEFSQGFTDLHTISYAHILEGHGFGLEECRNSIEIVSTIRNLTPVGLTGQYHPFAAGIKP